MAAKPRQQVLRSLGKAPVVALHRAVAGVGGRHHEVRLQCGDEVEAAGDGVISREPDKSRWQPRRLPPQARRLPAALKQQCSAASPQIAAADK